jgi:hypothetical protein
MAIGGRRTSLRLDNAWWPSPVTLRPEVPGRLVISSAGRAGHLPGDAGITAVALFAAGPFIGVTT